MAVTMKPSGSILPRIFLVSFCAVLILAANLCVDVNSAAFALSLHQPRTFPRMQALITPAAPEVQSALAQALTSPNHTATRKTKATDAFDSVWDWVAASIEYVPDSASHAVEDYWQTPAETLSLGTGDCEDYAILLVSLLRAYGVPEDEAYVAVGYELNDEWHAWVVERYYDGIWRILNVEYARDVAYMDSTGSQGCSFAYCFNDKSGFRGLPSYPPAYDVPEIPEPSSAPGYTRFWVTGVPNTSAFQGDTKLINPTFDTAKNRLGTLWLPSYLPEGYTLSQFTVTGNGSTNLIYRKGGAASFSIGQYAGKLLQAYPADAVEEVTVLGSKAYLVRPYMYGFNETTPVMAQNILLVFSLNGWAIQLQSLQSSAWTKEEFIKIAESLRAY